VNLPSELAGYIRSNTQNYGKAKLVLKRNKFWVESPHREVLETLLEDEGVAQVRRRGGGWEGQQSMCLHMWQRQNKEEWVTGGRCVLALVSVGHTVCLQSASPAVRLASASFARVQSDVS
jgi:hypothetical protein